MANKRRLQKRVREIGAQVEASIRADAEDQKLQNVASDELFQIDTAGGRLTKKQKLEKKDPMIKSKKFIADKANRFEENAVKSLKLKLQNAPPASAKAKKAAAKDAPMWGADGLVPVPKETAELDEYVAPALVKKVATLKRVASTRHKIKAVELPAAGQSYNPDFSTHQDVLAEAVAKEMERQEKWKEQKEPVAKGLSAETLQYIKTHDSDDEYDSGEDEDDLEEGPVKRRRAKEKVTTSQRNKRARHKQMEMEHKAKRTNKSLIKQINTSKHILQTIIKEEKQLVKKKELKTILAQQKLEEEPMVKVSGQLTKIERPTPVLLSDELSGSLRGLHPKGNALLERFDSMHKRNLIEVNNTRARGKRKIRMIDVKK